MARGAHAVPRTPSAAAKAVRTAVIRTSALTAGAAVAWTLVTTVSTQGYLDAFAAGTSAGASAGTSTGTEQPPAGTSLTGPQVREVEELNRKYACSTSGLEPGVLPARAVVRVGGEVRLATFEEGWAVHLGEVPGTLVSVCAR